MSIQFQCPGCSQPIEVDPQHAGQLAQCPYCRKVVTVPADSTLSSPPVASARPAGEPPPAPSPPADRPWERPSQPPPPPPGWNEPPPGGYRGGSLHVGPPSPKRAAAIAYGNYALICVGISLLLAVVMTASCASIYFDEMMKIVSSNPTSQPTPEQISQIQESLLKKVNSSSWIGGSNMGAAFFGLVGFVFAIASLRSDAAGNWRGWMSLVIGGMFVLCCCGGSVFAMLGGSPV